MIVSDERVARCVSEQLNVAFCPPYTAMGIERDGHVVCGVVFNQFEGANLHVTAAGSHWPLGFCRAVGRYVFEQLGCLRMTVTTEQWQVVDYALRLGGRVEGHMPHYYGAGRDAVQVGILRSDWKLGKYPAIERG